MKSTFKTQKSNLTDSLGRDVVKELPKSFSLRPKKSMIRNKSLKPFAVTNKPVVQQIKSE